MMKYSLSYMFVLLALCLMPQLGIAQRGSVTVLIDLQFNGEPLSLADRDYINSNGDTLNIDLLRFYMTSVQLTSATGNFTDGMPHLVDAELVKSQKFSIDNVASGSYTGIRFTLGVDSIANTSGANGGDLDPARGMYWAWNTGYVMAKLEGRSNVCKTLHHAFEFHVGGYMPPHNAARQIAMKLPGVATETDGAQVTIKIKADVAAWFTGINLAKTNSILIPGKEAAAMADRYVRMFTVTEVTSTRKR